MRLLGPVSTVTHALLLLCIFSISHGIQTHFNENIDGLNEKGSEKKHYSSHFLLYGYEHGDMLNAIDLAVSHQHVRVHCSMVTFSTSDGSLDGFDNMSQANACVHVGARVEPMHLHEDYGDSHIVAQTDGVDERYIIYGDHSVGAVSVCVTFIPQMNQGPSKPYLMEMRYNHTSIKDDVSLLLHMHAIQYIFRSNETLATCVARQKFLLSANRQRLTMDVDMQRDSYQFHGGYQIQLYKMSMSGIDFERITEAVSGCYNESMTIEDVMLPHQATWPHKPCSVMKNQRVLDTSKYHSLSLSTKDTITGGVMVALLVITLLVTLLYIQLIWKTSSHRREHQSQDLVEDSDTIPAIHKDCHLIDRRKSTCIATKNAWKRDPSEGRLFRASKQRLS